MIRLDIFSDPICPWCYLGKANLDRALEAHPEHPFLIEWHPFQLAPQMPREGVDRADYLLRIFGTQERTVAAHLRLEELGREAGVAFNFEAIRTTPNTLDAHRLIHWAGLEGRQTPVVSALFRAYWREGRDIGDQQVLTQIAGEAGLDPDVIARLLGSEADLDVIRTRERHAREKGISAVPTFIVADTYVLSGAQPPKLWGEVIEELARHQQDQGEDQ